MRDANQRVRRICVGHKVLHPIKPIPAILGGDFRRKSPHTGIAFIFIQGEAHYQLPLGQQRQYLFSLGGIPRQAHQLTASYSRNHIWRWQQRPAHLLRQHKLVDGISALPAVFNGKRQTQPTQPGHPLPQFRRVSLIGDLQLPHQRRGTVRLQKFAGRSPQHLLALVQCEFHVPYLGSPRPLCAMILRWISIVPAPCMCMLSRLRPSITPCIGAALDSGVSVPGRPRISIASWAK